MIDVIDSVVKNLEDWDIHPERLLDAILLGMSVEELIDTFYNVCQYECDNQDCLVNITIGFALLNMPDICREPGCNEPCAEDRYGSKFIKCETHIAKRHQKLRDWLDWTSLEFSGDLEKWK